jgi:hypothetical protein
MTLGSVASSDLSGAGGTIVEETASLVDVTDLDQLAILLEEGELAITEFYRSLPKDERADLIASLNAGDMLRPTLEALLPWEPQSEIRALLLDCIDPVSFGDSDAVSEDARLVALLDLPTTTPIGDLEWAARMELANAIHPTVGMKWVRSALEAFPASPRVNFTSSVIVLVQGSSTDLYTPSEQAAAATTLGRLLQSEAARLFSPSGRTRAYYALFNFPDAAQVLEIYRACLMTETDPRTREVLGTLQARLLVRAASLP